MRKRVKTWTGTVNDLPVTYFIDQDDDKTFVMVARVDDREFHSFGHKVRPSQEEVEKAFTEGDETFARAVGLKREKIITRENQDEFI
jgi:hypothetical protein